jgi:hypothetical protein
MSALHKAERVVSQLSPEDLAAFRVWVAKFDRANRKNSCTKLFEFFRQSPLAEASATEEFDFNR